MTNLLTLLSSIIKKRNLLKNIWEEWGEMGKRKDKKDKRKENYLNSLSGGNI